MDYYGIHTALCTPFKGKVAAVDHARLKALVNDQIGCGIHGLVSCGSTGEFPALTNEERRAVSATVCAAARGRVLPARNPGSTSAGRDSPAFSIS